MRVLVTGAHGFIGRHVGLRLEEEGGHDVLRFGRADSPLTLGDLLGRTDAIVHLAGENRPTEQSAFEAVNVGLTTALCGAIAAAGRSIPVIFASSAQAELDNPYGASKRRAEEVLARHCAVTGGSVTAFRLPGVFGKWSRPHYNSVVATFCHQLARGLEISVRDPAAELRLVYIDDVVDAVLATLNVRVPGFTWGAVAPEHRITLSDLAATIQEYARGRDAAEVARVGMGLGRALYATFLSHLPPDQFSYPLVRREDHRGVFLEFIRTPDCGQVSFFSAQPGVTRGSHYHHTKAEKFLVLRGQARFRFRHVVTGESHQLDVRSAESRVVESVPGWAHDVTNTGSEELIVLLWSSECFDATRPDTISYHV